MAKLTTPAYDQANNQNVKQPVIILQIEGLPYVFSSAQAYTKIRYDDPGVLYNGVYVYDGLRPLPSSGANSAKNYIDRAGSNASISQKLEQWDGKASIEILSIKLVDVKQEVTQLLAPGVVLSDIINRKVKVFFGYQSISYPEDYIRIFSGFINSYQIGEGYVTLTFTDPSSKRKQEIFNAATTTLTSGIDNSQTTIPVVSNTLLYSTILNAKGVNDPTITIAVVIDQEIITYTNSGINPNTIQLDSVTRGAFGTTPAAHSSGAQVGCFLMLDDNPINIALKTMLSGWNGPCFTGVGLRGIVNTDGAGTVPDTITFDQGVDLIRDYGLVEGDFITLSGSSIPANNDTFTIVEFQNDNRTVLVAETGILVQENPPTSTVAAFRSQFDTYPTTAGIQMTTDDVDSARHIYLRDTFIQFDFHMPVKGSETSGKEWIETHLFKAIGAYSLTQGSRVSMGLTHPPLQQDLTKTLDHNNIIEPKGIMVTRGLNERFFYNEVLFHYAFDPISGNFNQDFIFESADAQKRVAQVGTLEIEVRGLPDSPTSLVILAERAERILLRYQFAAETIDVKTKFGTGHTIDGGDIVVLTDKVTNGVQTPVLKISNTETGQRGIYDRVMEVQERSIKLSEAKTTLKLLSNNGFSLTDRYAVIAPASVITTGFTQQRFQVAESFGGRYGTREFKKWEKYQGQKVRVHSPDFTNDATSVFTLDPSNSFIFNLVTALGFTPSPGDIVEFAPYDESSLSSGQAVKNPYVFIDYTGDIASGSSNTVFTLQSGQGANYRTGGVCYVQSPDGITRFSPDVKIIQVVGDQITIGPILANGLNQNLGFTPQAGDFMKLGGFLDTGQSYRYI